MPFMQSSIVGTKPSTEPPVEAHGKCSASPQRSLQFAQKLPLLRLQFASLISLCDFAIIETQLAMTGPIFSQSKHVAVCLPHHFGWRPISSRISPRDGSSPRPMDTSGLYVVAVLRQGFRINPATSAYRLTNCGRRNVIVIMSCITRICPSPSPGGPARCKL